MVFKSESERSSEEKGTRRERGDRGLEKPRQDEQEGLAVSGAAGRPEGGSRPWPCAATGSALRTCSRSCERKTLDWDVALHAEHFHYLPLLALREEGS